ncbi:MAG TPA: hypothetical protein VIQ30_00255 [Pseudonocardia sp.]
METTERYAIEAWLGDDWTPEQVDTIVTEYLRWERTADLPDDTDERGTLTEAMLTAIAQHVDNSADALRDVARADLNARLAANDARIALQAATVVAVEIGGLSEYQAAEQSGVSRMTVRAWLGKR